MAESARQKILSIAEDQFYRLGFHAVGVDRIVELAGTTKTTFYRHFESKEGLILEILRNADRWWQRSFAKMLAERGGPTPSGQLRAVFDVLESMLAREAFNGCMFLNVSVEFPLPHDPIHQAANEHHRALEALVRDLAVRARVAEPVEFASQLTLLMNAAFMARQISGEESAQMAARRLGEALFARNLPAPGTTP